MLHLAMKHGNFKQQNVSKRKKLNCFHYFLFYSQFLRFRRSLLNFPRASMTHRERQGRQDHKPFKVVLQLHIMYEERKEKIK